MQRAQRWRVAGYHPLGRGAPPRLRSDESAQRIAHDLVVAQQVASHLERAQRASHAATVRHRSEHLGPCDGADLVVGEIELGQARVALQRRSEQRASLRRSKRGRSKHSRSKHWP